jgi:hypothetical protein
VANGAGPTGRPVKEGGLVRDKSGGAGTGAVWFRPKRRNAPLFFFIYFFHFEIFNPNLNYHFEFNIPNLNIIIM